MEAVVVNSTTNGARNDYQYDALSRMTQIVQTTPNTSSYDRKVDFTYTDRGDFDTITRTSLLGGTPTPVTTSTYGYDGLGRLESLSHAGASQNTIASYQWTFDANNRVTSFTSSNPADGSVTYNYDGSGQLVGADYSTSQADENYVYDLNGNRAYDGYQTGPGNQLLEDGTFRYEYDDEGNRTLKERLSTATASDYRVEYTWDYRQRLTDVTFKNNSGAVTKTVHYEYDVFDRLISKTLDADGSGGAVAAARFTTWDNDDVLLEFVDADAGSSNDAVLATRYLHGPAVDQVLAEQDAATGSVLYHLADNLGSVRDLVDTAGAVANHIRYDAFGRVVDETPPGVAARYRYTGRELDPDTGLQYNRARWYDPAVGRWLSEDPKGFGAGDANLYRYVENGPTNYVDPSGHIDWTPRRLIDENVQPLPGFPFGDHWEVRTDKGSPIPAWRDNDRKEYWCHGYTFGGSTAAQGPFSIYGNDVPRVLLDDGWKETLSCMARKGDIVECHEVKTLLLG